MQISVIFRTYRVITLYIYAICSYNKVTMSTAEQLLNFVNTTETTGAEKKLSPINLGEDYIQHVRDTVDKYGPRFWGIDTGLSIAPLPQTAEYKLNFLKKSLSTIPSLPNSVQFWLDGERDKTEGAIKKYGSQAIELSDEIREIYTSAPLTAHDEIILFY